MNLATFASEIMGKGDLYPSPVTGLSHMYDQGVRYGDISEAWLATYPMHMQVEMFEQAGLKPNCLIVTTDIAMKDANTIRRNIAQIKGYIDQMDKLNIPLIMPAPSVGRIYDREDYNRMRDNLTESLQTLSDYAKGSGITVCIENQSIATRADASMHDVRSILDAIPALGYVLDSGNFFCIREDVLEAYELLKDRMVHAHFKDWRWDPMGPEVRENLPRFAGTTIGQGVLPIYELTQRLKKDGYQGCVSLEFNSVRSTEKLWDDSAKFLRESFSLSL